jgi:hypothetical protein
MLRADTTQGGAHRRVSLPIRSVHLETVIDAARPVESAWVMKRVADDAFRDAAVNPAPLEEEGAELYTLETVQVCF